MRYSITKATPQQIAAVGGTNIKQLRHIPTIFAQLTDIQAQELKTHGATVIPTKNVVADVMPPTPVAGEPTYTVSQLLEIAQIDILRGLTTPPLYGAGVNVAVLGTGIRATHELIQGRVTYAKNFSSSPTGDQFDHDTAIAAIIVESAPQCNILDLKVLNDTGEGTEEEVGFALDHVLDLYDENSPHSPHIVNLSLGAPDDGNPDSVMRLMCREAINRGIWVTASAGNGGPFPGTVTTPAVEKYVCAMGSCRPDLTVSDFSSRGPTLEGIIKPDAVMFGENIAVASSVSNTAIIGKSGSSFAAPFSSGAFALYFQGLGVVQSFYLEHYPQMEPAIRAAFEEAITPQAAIDIFLPQVTIKPEGVAPGKDNDYGYGLPFGPVARDILLPAGVVGIDILGTLMTPIIVIGMMGMMMKSMK